MRASRTRWFTILAALLLSTVSGEASSAPPVSGMVRIHGNVLSALARAKKVAPEPGESNELITLTIVLRHDDQAAIDRYLKNLSDPHSKDFHKYLTQEQIADRFGPSRDTYRETLHFLQDRGFKLVEGSKNRLTITARGTRAQAERAFGVTIGDYQIGERKFYANDSDPELPSELAARVLSVGGLTNYAQPQPTRQALILTACVFIVGTIWGGVFGLDPNTANGKACILNALAECINSNFAAAGYGQPIVANFPCCNLVPGISICPASPSPNDPAALLADASTFAPSSSQAAASTVPLFAADGTGQTVGLVEFDNFNTSDVTDYLNLIGKPATNISKLSSVPVNGGASIGSGEDEVLLDIDTVMSVAPGAKVAVYDAPFSGPGSFQTVFNAAINGGVSIISNSWAYCEDETSSADAESIDTIFQNAAMAHISVFNGSGDSGSTCLDGSPNTVTVPADSPNATAVGGSSLTPGPGYTYGTETWWDDSKTTPVAGQGGFGTSKFFAAASYQQTLTGSSMRLVPDVVANADPFHGTEICQADNGGCPNGKQYGGTSMSAPEWAAFTALLNQGTGQNAGFANAKLYSLANTAAFHNATALGSDVVHVGLGSPDLNALYSMLSGQGAGAIDPAVSEVIEILQNPIQPAGAAYPTGQPDDGASAAIVRVTLSDSKGIALGGKTVTLSGGASNAKITPASAVSSSDGIATFQVTDLTAENVTLTATDSSDSVKLSTQPVLVFQPAGSTSASLNAFPSQVAADGMTAADITVVLQDGLGRPSPGKLIQINQTGGTSLITGPTPPVTNASGMIEFTAVDSNNETITYSAVDVTDGNLPFPENGMVTFSNSQTGCSNTLIAAPGFVATPYATGFQAQDFSFGNVNFGLCPGAWGLAFDTSGNLYVSDIENGNLYKFPPGGGVAGPPTLVANIGTTLASLVFDENGNLYGSRTATTGNFTTGAVFQIDPATGAIIRTVASNLTCPTALSLDPISGDLFTDDSCGGGGSDNPGLFEISGLSTNSPTTTLYANLPNTPNANIAFSPSGDMYIWDNGQGVMVTATNGPNPPVVTPIPGLGQTFLGMQAYGTQANGDAKLLIANFPGDTNVTPNTPLTISLFDLTAAKPTISTPLLTNGGMNGGANNMTTGPGGCVYMAQGVAVWKITDSSGGCNYTTGPALSLTPATLVGDAAQGSEQTFTAAFQAVTVPDGTSVSLNVAGANQRILQGTTKGGVASFTYTGAHQGVDSLIASGTENGTALTSNNAVITWGPGTDVTFLTINQSPASDTINQPVTLVSNLSDVSTKPASPLAGQQVNFSVGGSNCEGTTDANGNATCQVTPGVAGIFTLSANFAGTSLYNASSESRSFSVLPTPTIPPVAGKLKISPSHLNFGSVDVGSSKTDTVKITNAGKTTKKSHALPIVIEMESVTPSAFVVTTSCQETLNPGAKGVRPGTCNAQVTFTPTAAMKYSGSLKIMDNVDPSLAKKYPPLVQTLSMTGAGKAPK